jgi:nitric oxide reductase NorD protein
VLATAPTAARRLADGALFLQYLQFLNTLVAQAPRGLRPMLNQLDALLGQLTLGGLRRWALWGAQAHRTQYAEQIRYFGLESRESLAMLQQERKGTLLVDVQRRIHMYLRALWGRDFFLRPTAGDYETREGQAPFIEDYFIHLPDAYDAWEGQRAGWSPPSSTVLRPRTPQRMWPTREPDVRAVAQPLAKGGDGCAGRCAGGSAGCTAVPGLAGAVGQAACGATVGGCTYRHRRLPEPLARALLDPGYHDLHPWVQQGRALWAMALPQVLAQASSHNAAWQVALQLAHSFRSHFAAGQAPAFHPRTDVQTAPTATTTATSGPSQGSTPNVRWPQGTHRRARCANT